MEYASFASVITCEKNINKLQVIQNKCLRIVLCADRSVTVEELHKKTNMSMVRDRLKKMTEKYIASNILTENPLILNLARDYVEYAAESLSKFSEIKNSIFKGFEGQFTGENAWLIEANNSLND